MKISSIYPHISHTIPKKDSTRIQSTNFTKYEPQKTVTTAQIDIPTSSPVDITDKEWRANITKEYEELEEGFGRLEDRAREKLKNIVLEYDVEAPENDALLDAEMAVFGTSTGRVTYDMYLQSLDLKEALDILRQEEAVMNNGELKSAA